MTSSVAAYRRLMRGLLAWIIVHAVALVAMLVLIPGLPPQGSLAERAAYVAEATTSWRLGWLPWQLCAASDALLAVLLWRWAPSPWSLGALVATLLGIVPDQWGELLLITDHVTIARDVVSGVTPLESFGASERAALQLNAVYANVGYLSATVLWTMAVIRRGRERETGLWLTTAGCVGALGAATVVMWRALGWGASLGAAVPLNAAGFALLLAWALCLAAALGHAHHRDHRAADADLHRLRWPSGGVGRLLERLAASPGLRDLARPIPFVELASDIRDVVYLNWMVPADRVRGLLPAPLRAHCFGDRTAVSILTYAHGDFGPRFLGPLRRALPSPTQSNWRLYIEPPDGAGPSRDAIYFFKTVLSSAPHVVGSRLLSDGLPAHLAARLVHERHGDTIHTELAPGDGSAPDLRVTVVTASEQTLSDDFARAFDGWSEAVLYLVAQNRAVSALAAEGVVIESRIDIPIDAAQVLPARVEGSIESAFLAPLVAGCEPMAFVVPRVSFRALGERVIGPRESSPMARRVIR